MSAQVIPLRVPPAEPARLEGLARCLACHHEWRAAQPVGSYADGMECPTCHTLRGVWVHPLVLADGADRFVCQCRNDLFMLTRTGTFCVLCGEIKDFK